MLRRETSHCRTQLAETYDREHGNLSLLHPQRAPVAEGRGMGAGRTRMENGWGARERIEKGRPGGEKHWGARGTLDDGQRHPKEKRLATDEMTNARKRQKEEEENHQRERAYGAPEEGWKKEEWEGEEQETTD